MKVDSLGVEGLAGPWQTEGFGKHVGAVGPYDGVLARGLDVDPRASVESQLSLDGDHFAIAPAEEAGVRYGGWHAVELVAPVGHDPAAVDVRLRVPVVEHDELAARLIDDAYLRPLLLQVIQNVAQHQPRRLSHEGAALRRRPARRRQIVELRRFGRRTAGGGCQEQRDGSGPGLTS